MAIRFFQGGDYEATVLRKLLENTTSTEDGTQSLNIRSAGGSATPRYPSTYDTKNDLLRKLLENDAQALAGNMTVHLR